MFKPKTIIVDIDDTIFDTRRKDVYCSQFGSGEEYSECWNSAESLEYDMLIPEAREELRRIKSAGYEVIYLSGRHESTQLDATKKELVWNNFPSGKIILRRDDELKVPISMWKLHVTKALMNTNDIRAFFDNEEENLDAIEEGIENMITMLVPPWDGAAEEAELL